MINIYMRDGYNATSLGDIHVAYHKHRNLCDRTWENSTNLHKIHLFIL